MNEKSVEVKALIEEVCDLQKKLVKLNAQQKEQLAYYIKLFIMGEIPNESTTYH